MYFKSNNNNLKNIVFGYIYHEKQHLGYCAKFQKEEFTIDKLNNICKLLKVQEGNSRFIRHKSILPIGNYDINVIMWALNTHGKDIKWFDNRHIDEIDFLDVENLYGIIINKGNNGTVFNKHWYTLRPIYKDEVKMVIHETKIKPELSSSPLSPSSKESFNDSIDKENIESTTTNTKSNNTTTTTTIYNKPPAIPSPSLTTTITTKTNISVEPNKDNYSSTIESINDDTTNYNNNNNNIDMEVDENNEYPWWNLDSKLVKPVRFLSKEAV
ncbi:hypothetical protein BCR32DRAFT_277251 [Anaeromyces robustus]|uniref:ubiquitinyl hydrolase 1 n=1 Tax=Anaeromyces robustus TaxID=1754192 RepID=A0A1Y1XFT1_9FUNG|nr:hypothetical protein BCR32DRAFT_277251 [Anaeromyces robustus]|eukprot:ORX84266.1 hypothetical protein BCR32DRAFT_277251 [Anaeromyces robustus]